MKTAEEIKFSESFKFLDRVVNHWASEDNPQRIGLFVRYVQRQNHKCAELTDGKGKFWYCFLKDSRLQNIGNIQSPVSEEEIIHEAEKDSTYEPEMCAFIRGFKAALSRLPQREPVGKTDKLEVEQPEEKKEEPFMPLA